jgi:membrane protein YdbS with pleckstrin-like domain
MEPARRLAPQARWVWALQQMTTWGALTVVGAIVAAQVDGAAPWTWLVPAAALVVCTATVPRLRWSRWRWDVRDEGIDIRHGTVTIRRTLIPWVRVQHVDTRRGVLEQSFGLATVIVHTAAGGHTIPMLEAGEASLLRDRIARLARAEEAGDDA